MKLYITLLFGFLFSFVSLAQETTTLDFSQLDASGRSTNIFIDQPSVFSTLLDDSTSESMYGFLQKYKDFAEKDALGRFNNYEELKRLATPKAVNETVRIVGYHTSFDIISQEAVNKKIVTVLPNGVVTKTQEQPIYTTRSETTFAALAITKVGKSIDFYLDSKFIINTTNQAINRYEVDFGNGNGFIDVTLDSVLTINYTTEGKKQITVRAIFENGITSESTFTLKVKNGKDEYQARGLVQADIAGNIAPDLSIYPTGGNFAGLGEYEIFLGADGVLDKPIFLVDGFDPSDSRDITGLYDSFNYKDASNITQNLGDRIRNEEDFDLVLLNFPRYLRLSNNSLLNINQVSDTNGDGIIDINDYPSGSILIDGGADFIERNAMTLVALIELINSQKVGTQENVIIGPSMGGLISRFALTYMEQNSLPHETRLWVSFDSPHYGANVPVALQLLFNYFAYGYGDVDSVKTLVDGFLRSPAARQMLVDHFDSHINNIIGVDDPRSPSTGLPLKPTGAPGYRDAFQARMNAVGFPQQSRNISMTNGSGAQNPFNDLQGNPVLPGFDIINSNIDTGDVIIFINTRAVTFTEYMPAKNVSEKICDVAIQAQIFFWITQDTFKANAQSSSDSDGADSAPGGLFDIFGLSDSLGDDPVLNNFLAAMKAGFFSFIPTTSAMGLANQPDYYAAISPNNGDAINESPFDNWYMPVNNEPHVQLTQGNVDFAWDEIVNGSKSSFSASLFLEGAYDASTGLMRDDLRTSNVLPLTSPYDDAAVVDSAIFEVSGDKAVVDWVWVTLKDPNTLNTVAEQSALLLRDGSIVSIDGVSELVFPVTAKEYNIAFYHRNHIAVLSASSLSLSGVPSSFNFTSDPTLITGGISALNTLNTGIYGLISGDVDDDYQIQSVDIQNTIPFIGTAGYLSEDANLNGQVQPSDISLFIQPNVGRGIQF